MPGPCPHHPVGPEEDTETNDILNTDSIKSVCACVHMCEFVHVREGWWEELTPLVQLCVCVCVLGHFNIIMSSMIVYMKDI